MKALSRFMSRLPFAGNAGIRELLSTLYQSKTFNERLMCYLRLVGVLALFSFGHGVQVLMGVSIMFVQNVPFWAIVAGFLYAVINSSVILTHAYLGVRATKLLLSNRYVRNTSHSLSSCTEGQVLVSTAATLIGHLGLLVMFFLYVWPVLLRLIDNAVRYGK